MSNAVLAGKRIFYAEDNINNRAAVSVTLQAAGALVKFGRGHTVTSMILALRQNMPTDLVLLDLMYPNMMTGYDIYRAIREEAQFDDVPVVILSASDPTLEIPRSQELGLDGFIAKPINVRTFANQLASILDGEQIWYEGILS